MNTLHPQLWIKFHGLPPDGPARQVWSDSKACRTVYHFTQKGFKQGFAACKFSRKSLEAIYAEPMFATLDEAIAACLEI